MKRIRIQWLVMAFILFFIGISVIELEQFLAVSARNTETILIDAGHGGNDPGMLGIGQLKEKDINLDIALVVKQELEKKGYQVVMTRETDLGLYQEGDTNKKAKDLQNRIKMMKDCNPVVAISIHQNSYEDSQIKGPQVFYYETSEEGRKLAAGIQNQLNERLRVERPRKEKGNATYYLLKRSPCVLNIVECGFLTNPEEAKLLQEDTYQLEIAHAIIIGIEEYLSKNEELLQ